MARSIPGTVEIKGREVLYIEILSDDTFATFLDEEELYCADMPQPRSGGAIEEKVQVVLPDNRRFLGLSYKGDLDGWKNRFISCCQKTGRLWAIPKEHFLCVSDGLEVMWSECHITFDA